MLHENFKSYKNGQAIPQNADITILGIEDDEKPIASSKALKKLAKQEKQKQ